MSNELVVAIVGVLGAVATAVFAWWVERRRARRDRLAAIYTAYLEAYSKNSLLGHFIERKKQDGDMQGARALERELVDNDVALLKANSDLLVYGSRRVITAAYNLSEAEVLESSV